MADAGPVYADTPAVRARQLVADACWLLAVVAAVLAGRAVRAAVEGLAAPARRFAGGADDLAAQLGGAADGVAGAPLLGDDLAGPLERAADGARSLSAAGTDQVQALAHLAGVLGLTTALVPIVLVTVLRLVPRLRWWRRAAQARRLAATPDGDDLLALRALQSRSAQELRAAVPDPVRAWREQRPGAVRALADLELRALGLHRRPDPR